MFYTYVIETQSSKCCSVSEFIAQLFVCLVGGKNVWSVTAVYKLNIGN